MNKLNCCHIYIEGIVIDNDLIVIGELLMAAELAMIEKAMGNQKLLATQQWQNKKCLNKGIFSEASNANSVTCKPV